MATSLGSRMPAQGLSWRWEHRKPDLHKSQRAQGRVTGASRVLRCRPEQAWLTVGSSWVGEKGSADASRASQATTQSTCPQHCPVTRPHHTPSCCCLARITTTLSTALIHPSILSSE